MISIRENFELILHQLSSGSRKFSLFIGIFLCFFGIHLLERPDPSWERDSSSTGTRFLLDSYFEAQEQSSRVDSSTPVGGSCS